MGMRRPFVLLAESVALLLLLPLLLWSRLPLSPFSAFTAPSQLLSLVPGLIGILLRRVWYRWTLKSCGRNLTVDWLAVIRIADTSVGNHCTFGVANWIGLATIGDDVITGSHVTILSGRAQHGFADLGRPMRLQHGEKQRLLVASNVWIGAQTVVMADVKEGTVIGAGSIVTKTFPSRAIIAGNPARVLRLRDDGSAGKDRAP
jgi:virginiamycin A acetyltransferase